MNARNIGAAILGGIIVFIIYHVFFVFRPLDAIKSRINEIEKLVTARADTLRYVRSNLDVMEKSVSGLNQRVESVEVAQDAQKESMANINTTLEDAKAVAMQADEKASKAIKAGQSRVKTTKKPKTSISHKAKANKPVSADSDTLLAKLVESQSSLSERIDKLNERLEDQERESEPTVQSAGKEDSEKNRARLSAKTGKNWKNSFAF